MYNDKIRYLRKAHHMTQDDLAKSLNVKRHTVCDWESGRTEPNIDLLIKISKLYGVTINFLTDFENIDNKNNQTLAKYTVQNELESNLLSNISKMSSSQQEKLLTIIKSLKEFNR